MKKILVILLALCTAAAMLAGCGSDSALEDRVAYLEEQLYLLQDRVAELEAENSALKEDHMDFDYESESYAELIVDNWEDENNTLTLGIGSAGFTLAPDSTAKLVDARLILTLNGQTLETLNLDMVPSDGFDTMYAPIEVISFRYPDLSPADELELRLEVTLSDDSILVATGGGWYTDGDELLMISG